MILLLLQSALQPLGGFRPAQLSLSILSRKVLKSAVASGTSNTQPGEPGIYSVPTFATRGPQRLKRRLRTQQRKVELWARNGREFLPKLATSTSLMGSFTCRKARHGTDGFTSPPKESVLRIFSPELGYQRPARYL
jgi:hypothetical protein